MSRNGSTWPGALPSLKEIFRFPEPPHPSFGRFKQFLRSKRRSSHLPSLLATPEDDHHLSRPLSSVFSRRTLRNFEGQSTDTVDLGFRNPYDINKSLPCLDVAANADMAVSADEYPSTSSAPPPLPLSALSGKFPANWESDDLPSFTSAGLSGTDIALQDRFLGTGSLFFAADPTSGSASQAGPSGYSLLLGTQVPLFTANPTAPTFPSGPSAHHFLSGLPPPGPNALELHFADLAEDIAVPRANRFRLQYRPLPPLSPIPSTHDHDHESTNEEHDYGTPYRTHLANDDEPINEPHRDTTDRLSVSSYHTASGSPSQLEMVPQLSAIAQTIISDYFKPSKLVIDREVSLIDMQYVLFALRHCLQDLTIGPIGVGQPIWPSATSTIDAFHLASLKVDRVDFSFLKELLASVSMDNLRALDLRVESPESKPHELNIEWSRLTDLTLHDDFSPEVLNAVMDSLRVVTRLRWSGKLARGVHKGYSYELDSLRDLSVCSNERGCTFFLQTLYSESLQTLHFSHVPPAICRLKQHGLSTVRDLSIEHKINADEFLATMHHFPKLLSADFDIGGINALKQSGLLIVQQKFAQLTSLTLRSVSIPIRPLLMSIPLSELKSLEIAFDLKAEAKHQFCSGLADCLQKDNISLRTLRLVDANITREELGSILDIVSPTLVDYQVRQTRPNS